MIIFRFKVKKTISLIMTSLIQLWRSGQRRRLRRRHDAAFQASDGRHGRQRRWRRQWRWAPDGGDRRLCRPVQGHAARRPGGQQRHSHRHRPQRRSAADVQRHLLHSGRHRSWRPSVNPLKIIQILVFFLFFFKFRFSSVENNSISTFRNMKDYQFEYF